MSDKVNILQNVTDLDVSPEFNGYSKVIIWLDKKNDDEKQGKLGEDLYYQSGNDTGRTLELTCPWGTQEMADDILERITNHGGSTFKYQPYTASGAAVDPAVEIGDGVTIKDTYSGIYTQTEHFGGRHLSDISAPTEEEIDHEYPYTSASDRKMERKFSTEHAERITAELEIGRQIDARVSKEYDNETKTFGWRLTEDRFVVYGGSNVNDPVLKVTEKGLEVRGSGTFTGTVKADTGNIGQFTIKNGKLFYKKQSIEDENAGVYIGSDGISLGRGGAFKVDSNGNLTCNSGTFKGHIYARMIQSAGTGTLDAGYFKGSGIAKDSISGGSGGGIGQIAKGTIEAWNCKEFYATKAQISSLEADIASVNKLYTDWTHARKAYVTSLFLEINGVRRQVQRHVMEDESGYSRGFLYC